MDTENDNNLITVPFTQKPMIVARIDMPVFKVPKDIVDMETEYKIYIDKNNDCIIFKKSKKTE
jgi:hypothetical protein